MAKPDNQYTVTLAPAAQAALEDLRTRYPQPSVNAFFNAMVQFYASYATRGIDGNLLPYTLENGPKLTPAVPPAPPADIVRVVEQMIKSRPNRVDVWTEEQREAYRQQNKKV